jgi:acetyl esterase/lipase
MTQKRSICGLILLTFILSSACAPIETPRQLTSGTDPLIIIPGAGGIPTNLTATPTFFQPSIQPDHVQKTLNVAYASTVGIEPHLQSLDIYHAESNSVQRPVIIFVHGGGWIGGDKSDVAAKPEFFVHAGYVFVSINYRLSPQAKFPANVQDVATAIIWTIQNIAHYGGDPKQIYLFGHSAGGHLVTLVATDERYLKEQGFGLQVIRGVISLDTAGYDLSVFASRCKNYALPEPYSIAFGQDPSVWTIASPVTYIQAGKSIPRMIIIYSGDVGIGSNVRRELMAREFVDRLTAVHVPSELIGVPEKNHNDINTDFGHPGDPLGQKVLTFLSAQ